MLLFGETLTNHILCQRRGLSQIQMCSAGASAAVMGSGISALCLLPVLSLSLSLPKSRIQCGLPWHSAKTTIQVLLFGLLLLNDFTKWIIPWWTKKIILPCWQLIWTSYNHFLLCVEFVMAMTHLPCMHPHLLDSHYVLIRVLEYLLYYHVSSCVTTVVNWGCLGF